ncbi:MAG TPA: hypothetical protein VGC79_00765 [Polyangiaceae bacterium]
MTALGRVLLSALLVLPLVACGRRVGSVPFSSEGTKSTTLPLAAGNVAFWTDLDLAYEGPATLSYQIELRQGGRSVATASCDPLGKKSVELGWINFERAAFRSQRGQGKMLCSATLAKAGPTVAQAALTFGVHPLTASIQRADLVLKQ